MTPQTVLEKVWIEAVRASVPDSTLTCSKWAGLYRHVSPKRSARPGLWDNDLFPYLKEIMDAFSDPEIDDIYLIKPSQWGGTEVLINMICYAIDCHPGPMLVITEIEGKAQAFGLEALDPTIEETPRLRGRVAPAKANSKENNMLRKTFPGGTLNIVWASSPDNLTSRPAQYIFGDEVDKWKISKRAGDPVAMAEQRTKTFREFRYKHVFISSPEMEPESSFIYRGYMEGDQREWYMPCPHCQEYQTMKWTAADGSGYKLLDHIGEGDDKEMVPAYYVCDNGCAIEQEEKPWMLANGEWRRHGPKTRKASFKGSELFSPITDWNELLADFKLKCKDQDSLKTFMNNRLGEPFNTQIIEVDVTNFLGRPPDEDYMEFEPGTTGVPAGALILTAGIDVQDNRLECEVVGWGVGHESWSIDYVVFFGDPAVHNVWEDLSDYLLQEFPSILYWNEKTGAPIYGTMKVAAAAIDIGGHNASSAYEFTKTNAGRRWYAVKGHSNYNEPIISKESTRGMKKNKLYLVGTDTAKDQIFGFLDPNIYDKETGKVTGIKEPGSEGYCHFPPEHDGKYDEKYFKQLFSEKKVEEFIRGRRVYRWRPVNSYVRNEALDCRVYATAAREKYNPIYTVHLQKRARLRQEMTGAEKSVAEKPENVQNQEENEATPKRRRYQVHKSSGFR